MLKFEFCCEHAANNDDDDDDKWQGSEGTSAGTIGFAVLLELKVKKKIYLLRPKYI